jgi:hypothetical protein
MSHSQQSPPPQSSVYQESMEMVTGALLIYLLADIRELARNGKLPGTCVEDMQPPLTIERTVEIIQANKHALQERAIDHQDLEKRLQTLNSIQAHNNNGGAESAGGGAIAGWFDLNSLFGNNNNQEKVQCSTVLTHFCDEKANEEVVHAIVVNHVRKRITIVFRGSVSQRDFIQDAKCAQTKVKNPVFNKLQDQVMPETFNIHTGFYEYLFLSNDKSSGSSSESRLETILEDAKEQLRLHPGYCLYVSGHSLGGALSTLCGFYAAADDEIIELCRPSGRGSVVVYSVASPYVGNWKFRHVFQELERRKRLQHLRIANLEDMIPLLPFAVPKATILSPALSMVKGAGNLYKHVGMRLQFTLTCRDGATLPYSIAYPKDASDDTEYAKEVGDAMEAGKSLITAFYYLIKKDFETIEKYHRYVVVVGFIKTIASHSCH